MADRPQNKHLQPGTHLAALGVEPLAQGEATDTVRVRTETAALAWFKGLSAPERGQIVKQAYDLLTTRNA